MKYVTIKDIAKKLDLSVSTISRAFNDNYDINKKTKNRILETAQEMGYYPNQMARNLLQKKSFTVGMIIPEFINSFFPEVIIGAQEVFFEKGYQVLICQSNEDFETELKNVKSFQKSMVDGMLVSLSCEEKNIEYYESLLKSGFPMVFFNRVFETLNASKIVFNDYKWAFFATEHLIEQGYKKMVHLKGLDYLTLSKERYRGFKDAHIKHKIELIPGHCISTGFNIEDGEKVAQHLIDTNQIPDAIFAASDPTAIGAMRIFKKNGFKIPQDIGFVGFTESKIGSLVDPQLTSVSQPTYEIGREAARLLLSQIETEDSLEPQIKILDGALNIRDSSNRLNILSELNF